MNKSLLLGGSIATGSEMNLLPMIEFCEVEIVEE